MQETGKSNVLFIMPSSPAVEIGVEGEHQRRVAHLLGAVPDIFYYDEADIAALKRLLLARKYDAVVIGFSSLTTEFPEVQIVKSLAPQSGLLLYCPDMCFLRADQCGQGDSDRKRWQDLAAVLQTNACRQADLVVTESVADRELLAKILPHIPAVTVREIDDGKSRPLARLRKKTSIIMLTFNQLSDTRQCVASLQKHTPLPYELIFVDNGSVDDTRTYLKDLAKSNDNVKLIFNTTNLGFAKANNQGMKIATGDYVLLLNNDVILTDGWLDRLLASAESDPSVGVVGPCTNHASGRQVVAMPEWQDERELQKYSCFFTMKNAGKWFAVHRIIGFCMLIKREVIETVGILDERFGPGGFEDYDFCLRVSQAGYKILIAGDVFVYHIGGQGYYRNNLDYDRLRHQNVQLFIDKWCGIALETIGHRSDGRASGN